MELPAADPLAAFDDRSQLEGALLTLPRREPQVVVLRYLADLLVAAVAKALGFSAGASSSAPAAD